MFKPARVRRSYVPAEILESRRMLSVSLLKDLNTKPGSDYTPFQPTSAGAVVYFDGNDGVSGPELWKSDGTAAGTARLKDIYPGVMGSSAQSFTPVSNGTVFFEAEDGVNGFELWRTDGTAAGTVLVKDINPGPTSSAPTSLVAVGSSVFFLADDGVTGRELWKSDGTAAGTVLVKDIKGGSATSNIRWMVNANGTLFFGANDGTANGLWKSDGTTAGTVVVKQALSSTGNSGDILGSVSQLVASSAPGATRVYFTDLRAYLFTSDGTSAGTTLIDPTNTGAPELIDRAGTLYYVRGGSSGLGAPTGGTLYQWTPGGGAPAIVSGTTTSSKVLHLTLMNGVLYFSASTTANGQELWRLNATGSAFMVRDLTPQSGSTSPDLLTNVNGTLYFTGRALDGTYTLYKTDGTSANTVPVAPVTPAGGSSPTSLVAAGSTLLMVNRDATTGRELWRSDGTAGGTGLLKDIYPGTDYSFPIFSGQLGNATLFSADDGNTGTELWRTDGTAAGTFQVKDILPGSFASNPHSIAIIGSRAFFTADENIDGNDEPWVTDGTAAGTFKITDINPSLTVGSDAFGYTAMGNSVYFTANDGASGYELWRTDGTAANTTRVKDISPGSASASPAGLTVFNGKLYFSATDLVAGTELWQSDGTDPGTTLVNDIYAGSANGTLNSSNPTQLTRMGNALYFTAQGSSTGGVELWKTDGTDAGTVLVKDIAPDSSTAGPSGLMAFDGALYFGANDGVHGLEMWRSDGTADGTSLVRDAAGGSGAPAAFLNDQVLFIANDGIHGSELWSTRGTADSTAMVKDIVPGATGTSFLRFYTLNGRTFFSADNGVTGTELWVTDGTAAGTQLLSDLWPGPASGVNANIPSAVGNVLLIRGDDGVSGYEPFKVTDTFAPYAYKTTYDYLAREVLVVNFSENVAASLAADDMRIVHLENSGPAPAGSVTKSVGPSGETIATFNLVTGNTPLPDGNFRATIAAGNVQDTSGNPMAADLAIDFFYLNGDANHDRTVDTLDFNAVAANFGAEPRNYSQGDFNYDQRVDTLDFNTLAGQFGKTLPPFGAPQAAPQAVTAQPAGVAPMATAPQMAREGNNALIDVIDELAGSF